MFINNEFAIIITAPEACHSLISSVQRDSTVSSSFASSTRTPPTECKTIVYHIHTATNIKNIAFPFFFFSHTVGLFFFFSWDYIVSKAHLMNSGQLVKLKFIDRTATSQSACPPGCVALLVQSVRSICYWAALFAWQQKPGSITSIAWWLRREQRGHAC